MSGVDFTGNGANDLKNSVSSTNQPNGGKGGGKAVDFVGNGGQDTTHSLSGTNPPSGSRPGGKGEFQSPTDV